MMTFGWWHFSRQALEYLTQPVECEAINQEVEDLARESQLGLALHDASWSVRRAWEGSQVRAAAVSLAAALRAAAPVDTLRRAGWTIAVVGATVLVLNAIKPSAPGPFSSLLPLQAIGVGVLLMLMAAPLTRAWTDRRSRHKGS